MDDRRRSATAVKRVRVGGQEELTDTIKAAVAEAVAQREQHEAEELHAKPRRHSLVSAFLIVILIGFVASSLYSFFEIKAMSFPLEEELGIETGTVGVHLYSIAVRLERFRQENGHYPTSLGLVGLPADEFLEYTMVSGDEYRLRYSHGNIVRTYHSTQPPTSLLSRTAGLEN